jgi:hypothetical protein
MRQREQIFHFDPETPVGRIVQTKQLEHIADARTEPAYINGLQPLRSLSMFLGRAPFSRCRCSKRPH